MSERTRDLEERNAALRSRCAQQRHAVGSEVDGIVAHFAGVDRAAVLVRDTLLHPAVVVAGVVALLAFGRARGLRLVGRVFLLVTAARRLMRTVRML
jgi:hypothetical protein